MHGYGEQFFNSATGPMLGHAQVHEYGWRDDRSIDLTLADVDGLLISEDTLRALPEKLSFAPAGKLEREGIATFRLTGAVE